MICTETTFEPRPRVEAKQARAGRHEMKVGDLDQLHRDRLPNLGTPCFDSPVGCVIDAAADSGKIGRIEVAGHNDRHLQAERLETLLEDLDKFERRDRTGHIGRIEDINLKGDRRLEGPDDQSLVLVFAGVYLADHGHAVTLGDHDAGGGELPRFDESLELYPVGFEGLL